LRHYKKGEIIISQGDTGNDVYYIFEGEVEIYFSAADANAYGTLNAGSFFGEMGYLLSESRCATIRAKTDASLFVLSPAVFDDVLKYDTNLDRDLIQHMSRRLKDTTEQIKNFKK
jgi:CRP-like cAMP-binding protein